MNGKKLGKAYFFYISRDSERNLLTYHHHFILSMHEGKREMRADKSSTPKKKLRREGEADFTRISEEGDNRLSIPELDSDVSIVGSVKDKADIELSIVEEDESHIEKSGIEVSIKANIESERAVLFDMLKGYDVTR